MRIKLENFIVFFFLLGFWHFIFSILGLYGSKRLTSRRAEVIDVVKATSLAAGFLLRKLFPAPFSDGDATLCRDFLGFQHERCRGPQGNRSGLGSEDFVPTDAIRATC